MFLVFFAENLQTCRILLTKLGFCSIIVYTLKKRYNNRNVAMSDKYFRFGLDIGIGSVGWAVLQCDQFGMPLG